MKNALVFMDFSYRALQALENSLDCLNTNTKIWLLHEIEESKKGALPMIGNLESLRLNKTTNKLSKLQELLTKKGFDSEVLIIQENNWKNGVVDLITNADIFIYGRAGLGNAPLDEGKYYSKLHRKIKLYQKTEAYAKLTCSI